MDAAPRARFGNIYLFAARSLGDDAQKLRVHPLVRDELLRKFPVRFAAGRALHHPQLEGLVFVPLSELPDTSSVDKQLTATRRAWNGLRSCKSYDVPLVYSSPVCYTYHGFRSATRKPEAVACQSGISTLGARATAFLSALFDSEGWVYRFCFPGSDALRGYPRGQYSTFAGQNTPAFGASPTDKTRRRLRRAILSQRQIRAAARQYSPSTRQNTPSLFRQIRPALTVNHSSKAQSLFPLN